MTPSLSPLAFVLAVLACAAGAALGAFVSRSRGRMREMEHAMEAARLRDELRRVDAAEQQSRDQARTLEARWSDARVALGRAEVALEKEREQFAEKLALLNGAREQLREQLKDQFKSLANEILEEKSKRFTEQNHTHMQQLLGPLKDRLQDFQKRVEQVYDLEAGHRNALRGEVSALKELNQKLSTEANALTQALRGSSKVQGDWGEMILERILELSGFERGVHYRVQETFEREDESRARPDVIVHLPRSRHMVIDAKVSLVAYSEHVNAADEAGKEAGLARHLASIRKHIDGLAKRNYEKLYGLTSLDCVIMFVPIEAAYLLALSRGNGLWEQAWEKNVLLVSPTTLLFVVRTVANLWRNEKQASNVQEIADRGAELYDRLTAFVADLCRVGEKLDQAKASYEGAVTRLARGRGNVIRQAEMLRDLGVKPSRRLPDDLVLTALEEDGLDAARE